MKQPTHGGKRTGAGRPKKEPTVTISFRVRTDLALEIKEQVQKLINEIQNQ
jgi:hypothetical protein